MKVVVNPRLGDKLVTVDEKTFGSEPVVVSKKQWESLQGHRVRHFGQFLKALVEWDDSMKSTQTVTERPVRGIYDRAEDEEPEQTPRPVRGIYDAAEEETEVSDNDTDEEIKEG